MNYIISKANDSDYFQILDIWKKGILKNHADLSVNDIKILESKFKNNFDMRKFPFDFWTAKKENITLGWVSISHVFTQPLKSITDSEISIYVNTNYLENGIGSIITKYVLNQLEKSTIKNVWAYVLHKNIVSKKMCEKSGMKVCGQIKNKVILIKEY